MDGRPRRAVKCFRVKRLSHPTYICYSNEDLTMTSSRLEKAVWGDYSSGGYENGENEEDFRIKHLK
jgi:hypothetical protein